VIVGVTAVAGAAAAVAVVARIAAAHPAATTDDTHVFSILFALTLAGYLAPALTPPRLGDHPDTVLWWALAATLASAAGWAAVLATPAATAGVIGYLSPADVAAALAASAGASAVTHNRAAGARAGQLAVVLGAPLHFTVALTAILHVRHYTLTTPYDLAAYPHSGYPDVASYLLSDALGGNIIGLVLYPIPLLALALLGAAAGTGLRRLATGRTAPPPPDRRLPGGSDRGLRCGARQPHRSAAAAPAARVRGPSGQLQQEPGQVPGPVAGNHVAGGDLPVAPGRRAPGPVGGGPERPAGPWPGLPRRLDVGARERVVLQRAHQPDRLGETAHRLWRAPRAGPRRLGRVVELAGLRRHQPVAADPDRAGAGRGAEHRVHPVAITGDEGVEVDQVPDPVADVLQRPGDHEPPVRETEEHDAAKILVQDGVDDIGDVGRQADLRTREVSALTDTGQAWRENLMTRGPERAPDLAEAVRAAPRAVNQNKDRHRRGPIPDE
jgi:hypothetical protein